MVQEALVCRAAAFGHEQEFVGVAVSCRDLDLGREVRARVLLGVHVEWGHLAVAQVRGLVRVVDSASDRFFVAAPGEHELSLLPLHNRGARVLAHGQHATRRDRRVLEQIERDEAVVLGGFGVIEDVA